MKNLIWLGILLCTCYVHAQKLTLNGKVTGADKKPVESATVYLSVQKDSTVLDYTITDVKGEFSIPFKKVEAPVFVTVSMLGFADFSQKFENLTDSYDFKTIMLQPDENQLDELVITADVAPIRIKKDTLEFNASSFKVRPDATVKELLEQLPGVEVSDEGKIKVNGKEVSNILVNGKPFFGADGKVALENLPSDIINKVQVTDYKSKEQKLTGAATDGNTKTINLTIDEDKNKGVFGRFIAGYGTDDRYEASMLFNYFKGDFKLSVLGASNNINSTGFSTNELFDNMSGGRNSFSMWSGDGSVSINGLMFGGGKGIYQTDMIGVNYGDNWGKKNKVSMNYLFNEVENKNANVSRIENLLPENRYVTESSSDLKSKATNHTFIYDIEMELDSLTTVSVSPKLTRGITTSKTSSTSETKNEFGELLNKSNSNDRLNVDTYSFENELLYARRFKRKGRSFSASFANKNKKNDTQQKRNSANYFYKTQLPDDIRNQDIQSRTHEDEYTLEIRYREPLDSKQTITLSLENSWKNEFSSRGTYDFNETTGEFNQFNTILSYTNTLKGNKVMPSVGYRYGGEKVYFNFEAGTGINNYDISSAYNQQHYINQRLDLLATVNSYISLQLGKSANIYGNYRYTEDSPAMFQMLEYKDLSNPLYITSGNKNLKTTQAHNFYLGYNNYDWQTRSGYNIYSGMNYKTRDIGTAVTFDESYVGQSTYVNVNDTYYYWAGVNYNKSVKLNDTDKITISSGLSFNGSQNKGIQNDVMFTSKELSWEPEASLTFDFNKKVILKPSYAYNLTNSKFDNLAVAETNYFVHKASFMTTLYWPKNVVFGSDITYNYNSSVSDGFKKDYLLWNLSLGYNFFNERFLAKVKVYDLLNQNQSVVRRTSATSIYDSQDIILKQYFMFSLTYKLEKFAGKKKSRFNFDEE